MNGLNFSPILPALFKNIHSPTFSLFDVGASGGISDHWRCFGDKLHAIGFDPLISEVSRLNAVESNQNIKYEAAFIKYPQYKQLISDSFIQDEIVSQTNASYQRTSSVSATRVMNLNYIQQHFNSSQTLIYTDEEYSIDQYCKSNDFRNVDFLKIDTDGDDYQVILSAENTIKHKGILGISVEVQFHGAIHNQSNLFCNIDSLLRKWGFSLFNLDIYRYSRGVFPSEFIYTIPAQTVSGQVQWGEAVYFRDLADPNYTEKHDFIITDDMIIKLACLFEMFCLPDCSAELILTQKDNTRFKDHIYTLLDALTSKYKLNHSNYLKFMEYFEKDPTLLYPSARKSFSQLINALWRFCNFRIL